MHAAMKLDERQLKTQMQSINMVKNIRNSDFDCKMLQNGDNLLLKMLFLMGFHPCLSIVESILDCHL